MKLHVIAAFLPAFLASTVLGQAFTNATCTASTSWMSNSLGQSPCLVGAYIGGVCYDGRFSVYALTEGPTDKYATLTGSGVNICECNAVFYNLIQACSYCQGSEIVGWANFTASCPADETDPTGFADTIPSGTAVPTWAFIDPRPIGAWSAEVAEAYLSSPSASITPGITTSASSTTAAGSSTTSTVTTTTAAASKSSDTGAIAGGVVGGLAVLALLIIVLIWLLRRNGGNKVEAPQQMAWGEGVKGSDFPASTAAQPTTTANLGYMPPQPSWAGYGGSAPLGPGGYGAPGPMPGMMGAPYPGYAGQEKPPDTPDVQPYNPNYPSSYPIQGPPNPNRLSDFPAATPYHNDNNAGARQDMGQAMSPPPIYEGQPLGGQGYNYRPEL